MLQIKNTLGGGKPEGLYAWKKNSIGSETEEISKSVSTLPYNFYEGCAVVLNEEIHILGGYGSNTSHYKWDGSSWTKVSTLPYNFYEGCAVVLNGEIHILGSSYDSASYHNHYKWNGSSWTSVSTLPYEFYRGCAVVLGGELHILGGTSGNKNHYKWDGSSWTSVSTLPYEFHDGCAVIFDGEIHILGTYYTAHASRHYKWDGSSWTSLNTLPYSFYDGSAVVFDGGIHILSSSDNSSYYQKHYLIMHHVLVYTFLDYIVSDKESAYPDGAEQDGYYYEKVSGFDLSALGFTKFAVDEYIPTYDQKYATIAGTAGGHKFNHSLGEVPKFAIIWCPNLMVSDYYGSRYYLASAEIGVSDPSAGDSNSKGFSIYSYTYSDANYLREGQSTNSALGACFKSDYVWTRYYSTFPYLKGGETYYIITFA